MVAQATTAPGNNNSNGGDTTTAATEKIEGHPIEKLLAIAERNVHKKTLHSKILDPETEARIPKFDQSEMTLGRVLGRGGFCAVYEVTKITLAKEAAADKDESSNGTEKKEGRPHQQNQSLEDAEHQFHHIVQDRAFMQEHCLRGTGKDNCRYALKRLQGSSRKDASLFVNAIVDLAVESRFLAVIRHPNIIKMRATAATPTPYSDHFFVVLDRLYDIMGTRLGKWRRKQPSKGLVGKIMDRKGKKEMAFWLERINVAYDLACALKYLHENCIIYRDLKPDNIGFDIRDDVKIFDFGLAKEFTPTDRDADGNYLLTGDTGSPRYMAPEVALSLPYNERVDVYSFCILLWQMLKLETPFDMYSMSMFQKKVVKAGHRPMPDPKWPAEITNLLRTGWGDLATRPSMDDVCNVLRDEINKNSDEEVCEIMDASRKSEISLHRITAG